MSVGNVRKIEWGDHGAYAYVMDSAKKYNIGDRVDLYKIQFNMKGNIINYDLSGPWYVYSMDHIPDSTSTMYRLIRGAGSLCFNGNGETYSAEDISTLYGVSIFMEAAEKTYVTFSNMVRRYRSLVNAAYNLKKYSMPIWDLKGDAYLVNIFSFKDYDYNHPFIKNILATRRYPNISKKTRTNKSTVTGTLLAHMSDMYPVSGVLLNPGFVIKREERKSLDSSTRISNIYFIVRACIINFQFNPPKVTIYVSEFNERDFMFTDRTVDSYHSRLDEFSKSLSDDTIEDFTPLSQYEEEGGVSDTRELFNPPDESIDDYASVQPPPQPS